jgi:hypothetical protein
LAVLAIPDLGLPALDFPDLGVPLFTLLLACRV